MEPLVPVALAFTGLFVGIGLRLVRQFDSNPSNWVLGGVFAVSIVLAWVATLVVWYAPIVLVSVLV